MTSAAPSWFARLRRVYRTQAHHPTIPFGLMVNDFFLARVAIERFVSAHAQKITGDVLDVGCGSSPYRAFFKCTSYVGVDMPNEAHPHSDERVDVFFDGKTLPFRDNAFDSIVCFEVLEHVFEPQRFLQELHRVAKPGATLLLTVPFLFNEHEEPNDFGRYSSFGLRHVLGRAGFDVETLAKLLNGPEFLMLMLVIYIDALQSPWIARSRARLGKLLIYSLFRPLILLLNGCGVLLSYLPRTQSIYFDNGVVCRRIP